MKIAIHAEKGSFSDRWIDYLASRKIPYKLVNCFDSNILDEVEDCDALMWHWNHGTPEAFIFARQLIFSVEMMGKKVYPNSFSCWHYDDKVGQKYLLEAIKAPLVPSYVFYSKTKAKEWVNTTGFPIIFKLRGGYGSNNVKLVRSKKEAIKLINVAFGRGFSQMDEKSLLRERINKFRKTRTLHFFKDILKGVGRFFIKKDIERILGKEYGYIYFQDFMPNNDYDTRLIIVGNKCFGFIRYNRANDFRASGSGRVDYSKELFDKGSIKTAFEISSKLQAQSLAFDFIYDNEKRGRIVEISYCFGIRASNNCPGYWNKDLEWIEGNLNIQECIMEDFLDYINN